MTKKTLDIINEIRSESETLWQSLPIMARNMPQVKRADKLMQTILDLAEEQNIKIDELTR